MNNNISESIPEDLSPFNDLLVQAWLRNMHPSTLLDFLIINKDIRTRQKVLNNMSARAAEFFVEDLEIQEKVKKLDKKRVLNECSIEWSKAKLECIDKGIEMTAS